MSWPQNIAPEMPASKRRRKNVIDQKSGSFCRVTRTENEKQHSNKIVRPISTIGRLLLQKIPKKNNLVKHKVKIQRY